MNPINRTPPSRRQFLRQASHISIAGILPMSALPAWAGQQESRALVLAHTHTGERIKLVYVEGGQYVADALNALNHFLRDHYTGAVGTIDPQVFDVLHRVQQLVGSSRAFEIISGYRAADTNARLRETRGGGVARQSLHMEGRALDVRLPGVSLSHLCDAALSLGAGGVGYYPREQFVHLDTGRVRSWGTKV